MFSFSFLGLTFLTLRVTLHVKHAQSAVRGVYWPYPKRSQIISKCESTIGETWLCLNDANPWFPHKIRVVTPQKVIICPSATASPIPSMILTNYPFHSALSPEFLPRHLGLGLPSRSEQPGKVWSGCGAGPWFQKHHRKHQRSFRRFPTIVGKVNHSSELIPVQSGIYGHFLK